jgi:hypothetical protein
MDLSYNFGAMLYFLIPKDSKQLLTPPNKHPERNIKKFNFIFDFISNYIYIAFHKIDLKNTRVLININSPREKQTMSIKGDL